MLLVLCAMMVMSSLWVEVNSGKEQLRYASTIHGELFVTILGVTVMQVWSVHNWDTPHKVRLATAKAKTLVIVQFK